MVGAAVIFTDRFVFVHVPKTGGSSITEALGGKTPRFATHTPLRCVIRERRLCFGFVRNPWARMVSLYRFMCQKVMRETDSFDQDEIRAMGFKRWLMEDEFFMQEDSEWDSPCLPPMQRRPQLWWLSGADFIGQFENLQHDFRYVTQLLDIAPQSLGHSNQTVGGTWRKEYDDESLAFVADHFAPDIDRFGYRF